MGRRASCFYGLAGRWLKDPAQGAATSVFAATAPELAGHSGAYLQDSAVAKPWRQARDAAMAEKLWLKSEELVAGAGAPACK